MHGENQTFLLLQNKASTFNLIREIMQTVGSPDTSVLSGNWLVHSNSLFNINLRRRWKACESLCRADGPASQQLFKWKTECRRRSERDGKLATKGKRVTHKLLTVKVMEKLMARWDLLKENNWLWVFYLVLLSGGNRRCRRLLEGKLPLGQKQQQQLMRYKNYL